MLIRAPAILCSSRAHGEHGAIVRLMTADHGLAAAYVAGARGRELRPLLDARTLTLALDLPREPLVAGADALRFQQVVRNVLCQPGSFDTMASAAASAGLASRVRMAAAVGASLSLAISAN